MNELKLKHKTVGLCPTPCKLFEKSLTKTLTGNAQMRISKRKGLRGLVPLQGEGTASLLGVWGEAPRFQKGEL